MALTVEKNEEREPMDWLYDMKSREVKEILTARNKLGDDSSVSLVYEYCGLDVLVSLWKNLSGITIYVSERALNDLRKLYIRQNYKPNDPLKSIKVLAAKLRVSEQFVREAIAAGKKEKHDTKINVA
jgi:hypothetical protein